MNAKSPPFEDAVARLDLGDVEGLQQLLSAHPELARARDDGNATLLIRLIDWPGHRPRATDSARLLLEAGADVDARRNDENGTALSGALCTEEVDVLQVLLEFGADVCSPCGWQSGAVLDLADDICQNGHRVHEENVRRIAELFTKAAGRAIPSRPPMGGTTPLVFFDDVDAGVEFYTKKLGFRVNFAVESECDKYVSVQRGATELHVTTCQCEDKAHVGRLSVRVSAAPIDPLYEEFLDMGVTIRREPKNESWGLREFEIEDPQGNRLLFFGPPRDDASE